MIETIAWLADVIAAAIAFAAVYLKGWRIVPASLAGAVIGTALWAGARSLMPSDDVNYWFQVDLALNGSFCLIFAAAGAGLAELLKSRRSS